MARYHQFHLDVDLEARMGRVLVRIHDRAGEQPHCNWGGDVCRWVREQPAVESRTNLGNVKYQERVLELWYALSML